MTRHLHWGTAMAAVYITFAAATLGFVVFAMGRPAALVSPEYYSRALQHDDRIEAAANARALGGAVHAALTGPPTAIQLELPAAHAATAAGRITLYRPSDAAADRTMPLVVDAEGRQRIPLDGLAPGRWRLQVEWTADQRAFYAEWPLEIR